MRRREADAEVAQLRGMSALQLARVLRGDLDNIVAKALKKEPAERYATADAFASDLQHYLNHEPVSARRRLAHLSDGEVRPAASSRASAAVSLIVLVLVAGIAGTTWQAIEAQAPARGGDGAST